MYTSGKLEGGAGLWSGTAGALYRTIVFDVFQVAYVKHFHTPKGTTSTNHRQQDSQDKFRSRRWPRASTQSPRSIGRDEQVADKATRLLRTNASWQARGHMLLSNRVSVSLRSVFVGQPLDMDYRLLVCMGGNKHCDERVRERKGTLE